MNIAISQGDRPEPYAPWWVIEAIPLKFPKQILSCTDCVWASILMEGNNAVKNTPCRLEFIANHNEVNVFSISHDFVFYNSTRSVSERMTTGGTFD